jgi:hypothetical protein
VTGDPDFQRILDGVRAERLRDLIAWCDHGVVRHSQFIGVIGDDHRDVAVELAKRLVEVGLAEMVGDIELVARRYSDQSVVAMLAKYSRILGEELRALEPTTTSETIRADRSPLFPKGVPEDSDLVDLVTRIDAERNSCTSWNEIARQLLGESKGSAPRSESLLRQIRRMRNDGRVNL